MTGQPRKWDQDIICLYDESGLAGAPWAAAGYAIHCYDIINTFGLSQTGDGITVRHNWDVLVSMDHFANLDADSQKRLQSAVTARITELRGGVH